MPDTQKKNGIPVDVYIPFVGTLFRDGQTITISVVAQTSLAVLCYLKTQDSIYLLVALALVGVALPRLRNIRRFASAPPPADLAEARRRENHYIFYGTLHGLIVGLFCFTSIFLAPDEFAQIAAVSSTLASVTGIAGRNYGSPRMVMIFIVTMMGPMALGFFLRADPYYVFLGCMFVPFLVAIRRFAFTVREVLFTALSEEKKANRLAQRFNRALNTMSHGLVMLNAEGRVVVANAEAARLMSLSSPDRLMNRTVHALLMRGVAGGMLRPRDCRFVEAQLTGALRQGRGRKVLVSFNNGQHYEFSAREGSHDLGVITFEDVTARVAAEEKIRSMARFDSLTNLPNRAYFNELAADRMAGGDQDRICGLAVIDLDDFKSVNDTLGHPVGDGLIFAVGQRLAAFAAERLIVSRFGGDEFMLFIDDVADASDLKAVLDNVFSQLRGEVDVAGHALRIQASGGAVLARVRDTDVDGMIVRADLALYKAKELGRNNWRMFEAEMDEAFRSRQLLKADLRSAVEAKALRVVYQPIVLLDSMRIAACEALCRWDHPELGAVSPAVFIPLAEEMGIISDISVHVLETAAAECAGWPEPISVSVNLSAKDFRSRAIVDTVRSVLGRSGLSPDRLEIEVTETALLDDKSLTRQVIEEIKGLGVRIALDDFGTGYSSLSYLHKLPLDKIKIDRSFLLDVVQNKRSLELLKGIVNLSRPLGLTVTVEGVETFDQLKVLAQAVKPDLVQGFLFGAALSGSGIQTMSNTVWPFADSLKARKRAVRG